MYLALNQRGDLLGKYEYAPENLYHIDDNLYVGASLTLYLNISSGYEDHYSNGKIYKIGDTRFDYFQNGRFYKIGGSLFDYYSDGKLYKIGSATFDYFSNGKYYKIGQVIFDYYPDGRLYKIGNDRV